MSYKKTDKWFQWNKERREQGLIPIACTWPNCTDHVIGRELAPGKFQKYKRYRVTTGNIDSALRYPICETHQSLIRTVLGDGYRLNGIKAIINGQSELASRHVGTRLTRLVIHQKTSGCCAACNEELLFDSKWHADHITPLYLGGLTSFANLQALCKPCHRDKSRIEKSDANKGRYDAAPIRSWQGKHQLKLHVQQLQKEVARLKSILARYICEEEGVG